MTEIQNLKNIHDTKKRTDRDFGHWVAALPLQVREANGVRARFSLFFSAYRSTVHLPV